MGDILLNGRAATDYELAAIGHARRCEFERDLKLLAGVLTNPRPPEPASRPVSDVLPVLP
jgi:hypothetical protein